MYKEIILIIAAVISIILFFKVMNMLAALHQAGKISNVKRGWLTYVSAIAPIIGFVLVQIYKLKLKA